MLVALRTVANGEHEVMNVALAYIVLMKVKLAIDSIQHSLRAISSHRKDSLLCHGDGDWKWDSRSSPQCKAKTDDGTDVAWPDESHSPPNRFVIFYVIMKALAFSGRHCAII